jgi:hypothetical protein
MEVLRIMVGGRFKNSYGSLFTSFLSAIRLHIFIKELVFK